MTELQSVLPQPRPKLIPIKVPWQVDARGGRLILVAAECSEDRATEMHAMAYVLPEDRAKPFELRHIKLTFLEARAARLLPFDGSDLFAFDASRTRTPEALRDDMVGAFRDSEAQWRRLGFCSDPGFYRVEGSLWLKDLMLDDEDEQTHYYAFSRSACVDIIARSFEWETVQVFPDAPPPMGPDGMVVTSP